MPVGVPTGVPLALAGTAPQHKRGVQVRIQASSRNKEEVRMCDHRRARTSATQADFHRVGHAVYVSMHSETWIVRDGAVSVYAV